MVKKFMVLFMILSFGVFGLTACSGNKKEKTQTSENAAKQ